MPSDPEMIGGIPARGSIVSNPGKALDVAKVPVVMGLEGEMELAPPTPVPVPSRLTVVCTATHQPSEAGSGVGSSQANESFSAVLKSDEQAYSRRTKATEEWKELDCGWIPAASLIVLTNEEGKHLTRVPSEKEKEEMGRRVLEVGYLVDPNKAYGDPGPRDMHSPPLLDQFIVPIICLYPGRFNLWTPTSLEGLMIRCREGTAAYSLRVIPE